MYIYVRFYKSLLYIHALFVPWRYDDPGNGLRRRPTAAMPFLPAFLAWGVLGQMLRRAGFPQRLRSRHPLHLVLHPISRAFLYIRAFL